MSVNVADRRVAARNSPRPSSRGIMMSLKTRSGAVLRDRGVRSFAIFRHLHVVACAQQASHVVAHVSTIVDEKDPRTLGWLTLRSDSPAGASRNDWFIIGRPVSGSQRKRLLDERLRSDRGRQPARRGRPDPALVRDGSFRAERVTREASCLRRKCSRPQPCRHAAARAPEPAPARFR